MKDYSLYNDEPVIRTFSGIWFDCFNPKMEMISIIDIAHSLSHQCRFGGHLPKFYSVADHSIRCSMLASPEHKLAALLHDASEGYLLDIPRPIKKKLANYKEIEDGVMRLIAEKFGFDYPLSPEVKAIDEIMLQTEWDGLMIKSIDGFKPLTVSASKKQFLKLFNELN